MEEIQFGFTPTKKDYIKVSRAFALHMTSFWVITLVVVVLTAGGIAALFMRSLDGTIWRDVSISGVLIGGIYILFYFQMIPWQIGKAVNGNAALVMARTWQVSQAGVRIVDEANEANLKWEKFKQSFENKEYYMIIYQGTGRANLFVPKQVFADCPEKADALVKFLKEKGRLK